MDTIPYINNHHAKNQRHSHTLPTTQHKPNTIDTSIRVAAANIRRLPIRRTRMADTTTFGLHIHVLSIHNHSPVQTPKSVSVAIGQLLFPQGVSRKSAQITGYMQYLIPHRDSNARSKTES